MKKWIQPAVNVGLFAVLLLPLYSAQGGEPEKLKFVGDAKCKMCHNMASSGKYWDDWSQSKHAKAFSLLKGDEQKDAKCLKCHTTGFGEPGGFTDLEKTPKMVNVQCEMCHGPGEKHAVAHKKENPIPHSWKPEEKTCVKCHNKDNPNWKEDKYTDKNGKKTGFDFEQAVKLAVHKVKKEESK